MPREQYRPGFNPVPPFSFQFPKSSNVLGSNRTVPMSPATVNKSPLMFEILSDGRIRRLSTEPMINNLQKPEIGIPTLDQIAD